MTTPTHDEARATAERIAAAQIKVNYSAASNLAEYLPATRQDDLLTALTMAVLAGAAAEKDANATPPATGAPGDIYVHDSVDEDTPEYAIFGADTRGIVDEEHGGVVLYVHKGFADRALRGWTAMRADSILHRAATAIYQIDSGLRDEMRHFDADEMNLLGEALGIGAPTQAQTFDGETLDRLGLRHDPRGMWRILGTGWRIYEAHAPYFWGYSHDEDGKEYGEVETLSHALNAILEAEKDGDGDNIGHAQITIPAIQRVIDVWASQR